MKYIRETGAAMRSSRVPLLTYEKGGTNTVCEDTALKAYLARHFVALPEDPGGF